MEKVLLKECPGVVVIEACAMAGWINDLCERWGVARKLLVRCWAMLRDKTTWRNTTAAAPA